MDLEVIRSRFCRIEYIAQLTGRGGAWYVPVSAFPTSEANYCRVSEKRARSSKLACPVPMVLLQKSCSYVYYPLHPEQAHA